MDALDDYGLVKSDGNAGVDPRLPGTAQRRRDVFQRTAKRCRLPVRLEKVCTRNAVGNENGVFLPIKVENSALASMRVPGQSILVTRHT